MATKMRWYQVRHQREIRPVEVLSETTKFVTLAPTGFSKTPQRVAKNNEYFPTFAEARTALLSYLSKRQDAYKQEVDRCKTLWEKVFLLEERCKSAKNYKGLFKPTCNNGHPCLACREKWGKPIE